MLSALHSRAAARPSFAAPAARGRVTARRPVVARATGDSVDDVLAAAEALLAAAGGSASTPAPSTSSSTPLPDGVELRCDVNGCSIVPLDAGAAAPSGPPASLMASLSSVDEDGHPTGPSSAAAPADFELAEGPGWRLGVDRAAAPGTGAYCAVVGGDGWSAALTRDEYDDLTRLLANLRESVATLHVCGDWDGASEDAALEMSTPRVWVQGRAPLSYGGKEKAASAAAAFDLRFILLQAREFEGLWHAAAVAGVLAHLDGGAGAPPADAAAALAAARRGGVAANA